MDTAWSSDLIAVRALVIFDNEYCAIPTGSCSWPTRIGS